MNDELSKRDVFIILAYQSAASHGYIFSKLRLVSMTWDNYSSAMHFYIDGQISDDDDESINLIGTYFGLDSVGGCDEICSLNLIRIDYPEPISFEGECVFARKENPPIGKVKRGVLTEKGLKRRDKVLIAAQRAMIGLIFSQIRHVVLQWTEDTACISFRVDGELAKDGRLSIEQIRQYFTMQFPKEEMIRCDVQIFRIDFPTVPTVDLGTIVYSRKEYSSNGGQYYPTRG